MQGCQQEAELPPLPPVPLSRDVVKSYIYEVTQKWQVKTSRSFLCDCCSPRVGSASGLGSPCHQTPGGWHGGFPAEAEQDCWSSLEDPQIVSKCQFPNS